MEKHKWVKQKHACALCGSSDAASTRDDGLVHCFSCGKNYGTKEKYMNTERLEPVAEFKREFYNKNGIPERMISKATADKYGVSCSYDENGHISAHHYPYYTKTGVCVGEKVRQCATKSFTWNGKGTQAETLFGQTQFGRQANGNKCLFICEGEVDAMSVYEMTGFPAVSLRCGAQSLAKEIKENYGYINLFEKIFICMDNDKAGQEALNAARSVFPPRKTYISTACPPYKDPNDYLMAKNVEGWKRDMWWGAKQHIPDGIVDDPSEVFAEVLKAKDNAMGTPYPYAGLNKLLYGMSKGEVITFCAGTGIGKSQVLREMQLHLLKTTNDRIGLLMLEETIGKTALGLISLDANLPLHKPDCNISKEELKEYFDRTVGLGRISFYGGFKSFSVETIKSRIEYMIRGCDCKFIFLDHISILVSSSEVSDERKTLDEIMHAMAELAVTYDITLILVSHLRRVQSTPFEEGGTTSLADLRGTAGIGQLSFTVIGLERNQQSPDPVLRDTTTVRVLKNRKFGETGIACKLLYNRDTGRLVELDSVTDEATPAFDVSVANAYRDRRG